MPIYYKTVYKINNRFYSCVITDGPYCIEYKLGETITDTKLNGIFVFETLDFARRFIGKCFPGDYSILAIDSLNNQPILPIRYDAWDLRYGKQVRCNIQEEWPAGTLCFRSINVLKEEYQHTIIWDTPTQAE